MLGFIYFSGVLIVFLFMILFDAWLIANDEVPEETSILDMLINVLFLPWFSWLIISIVGLSLAFEYAKKETKEQHDKEVQ